MGCGLPAGELAACKLAGVGLRGDGEPPRRACLRNHVVAAMSSGTVTRVTTARAAATTMAPVVSGFVRDPLLVVAIVDFDADAKAAEVKSTVVRRCQQCRGLVLGGADQQTMAGLEHSRRRQQFAGIGRVAIKKGAAEGGLRGKFQTAHGTGFQTGRQPLNAGLGAEVRAQQGPAHHAQLHLLAGFGEHGDQGARRQCFGCPGADADACPGGAAVETERLVHRPLR